MIRQWILLPVHLYENFPELLWFLFVKLFKDRNWISVSSYLLLNTCSLQKLEVKLQHLESRPIFLGRKQPSGARGRGGTQGDALHAPWHVWGRPSLPPAQGDEHLQGLHFSEMLLGHPDPIRPWDVFSSSQAPHLPLRSVSLLLATCWLPRSNGGRGQFSETARSLSLPSCLLRGTRGWS